MSYRLSASIPSGTSRLAGETLFRNQSLKWQSRLIDSSDEMKKDRKRCRGSRTVDSFRREAPVHSVWGWGCVRACMGEWRRSRRLGGGEPVLIFFLPPPSSSVRSFPIHRDRMSTSPLLTLSPSSPPPSSVSQRRRKITDTDNEAEKARMRREREKRF